MKTIKIKDYYGIYQEIPVSDELYEEWRALQNETQRIHRKEVYHRDWTPMDDLAGSEQRVGSLNRLIAVIDRNNHGNLPPYPVKQGEAGSPA